MSRKQPKRWSVRFELGPEEPEHVRLHDYLMLLAETDDGAEWMRQTLIAALPAKSSSPAATQPHPALLRSDTPSVLPRSKLEVKHFNATLPSPSWPEKRDADSETDEPTYEDIEY